MDRRKVLAVAGTAVLGTGVAYAGDSLSNPSDSTSDESTFERTASVLTVDTLPDSSPVGVDVTVTRDRITNEQSAILTQTITNKSHDSVQVRTPLYKEINERREDQGLFLFSLDTPMPFDRAYSPNCRGDPNGSEVITGTYEGRPRFYLDPGESVDTELVLVNDLRTEGCFTSGTYQYETDVHVNEQQFDMEITIELADS